MVMALLGAAWVSIFILYTKKIGLVFYFFVY
jgi:hypothetical protein